jgi:hypothetical protein
VLQQFRDPLRLIRQTLPASAVALLTVALGIGARVRLKSE